jgi:endo-1,4-beta-xylanase
LTPTPAPSPASTSLRALADQLGFGIGTNAGTALLHPEFANQLSAIQAREFNLGSAWGGWRSFEPTRGARDFGWIDGQIRAAVRAGMKRTFGYFLINGYRPPPWIQDIQSRSELIGLVTSAVSDALAHTKGRVDVWNVVCEAQHPRGDALNSVIGQEYVEMAFRAARNADPVPLLCYVDYDNHTKAGTRYRHTKGIVDQLRAASLIDMVGVECIIHATDPPTHDDMVAAFQSYGMPVIITELAVLLHGVSGPQRDRLDRQAAIYQTVFQAALNSGVCNDIIVESIGDRLSSWETQDVSVLPGVYADNDSTMYDDDFQPKPAYYSVSSVLQSAADRKKKAGVPLAPSSQP